jgi:putative transposase
LRLAPLLASIVRCSHLMGCPRLFRHSAKGIERTLRLRYKHRSQLVADAYQTQRAFLGIVSSPVFVRDHEGNGCAEVCIRTLTPNPWIPRFATLENPRLAPGNFKHINNQR